MHCSPIDQFSLV